MKCAGLLLSRCSSYGRQPFSLPVIGTRPAVSVEPLLSDGSVDVFGQEFDMALRFGPVTDSSLRVRSLGPKRRLVCAAPGYVAEHGAPVNPDDLTAHNGLVMRLGSSLDNGWRFGAETTRQIVTVRGNRVANDGALVRQWCLAGLGIMLKWELDVAADVHDGRLVQLLAEHAPPPAMISTSRSG